jgi:hypothetical protein
MEDAAMAAAVSAARSEPPQLKVICADGLVVRKCMTSAEPQKEWSDPPVPTWPHSSLGALWARMK